MRSQFARLSLEVRDDRQGFSVDDADTSRRDVHVGRQLPSHLPVDARASLPVSAQPADDTAVRLVFVRQR